MDLMLHGASYTIALNGRRPQIGWLRLAAAIRLCLRMA